ncbi:hypothetical protein VMCG_09603 [Cytospora schulzeri]|uniref:Uncharacterized protein n=1 Tax=Cytospora schulzeri TaxID=448051 RepID=A0A423VJ79_9PEZI|nr:hypothetical protein VMCG_09603 [Valsa malicola]
MSASGRWSPERGLLYSLALEPQDKVLGLLNTLLGANDLDGFTLVTRHVDLAAALFPDRVDLATALANNVAVRLGVREDQEAGDAVLGLLYRSRDGLLGLLDVLWRSLQDPWDIALLVGSVINDVPGMGICGGLIVVGDERQRAPVSTRCSSGLSWRRLTGVVNGHVEVVSQSAEELSTVRDGLVQASGDLDGLCRLLLCRVDDVLLGLLDICLLARDLNSRLSAALAGNVDRHLELRLQLPLRVTTTTDEGSMLLGRHIDSRRDLALTVGNELFDMFDELVDDVTAALELDGVPVSLLLGELDDPSALPWLIRTTSLDNHVPQVGTWAILLLLEDLLGLQDVVLLALDHNLDRGLGRLAVVWYVDLSLGLLTERLHGGTTLANQRWQLLSLYCDSLRVGVCLQPVDQLMEFVVRLGHAPAWATDDHLVWSLLATGLSGLTGRIGVGFVVLAALVGAGEEDEDLVSVLQLVDLTTLGADQFTVELGINCQGLDGLVRPVLPERLDMRPGSSRLSLGALELNLSIFDLDIDIKLVTQLLDVAAALADKVVGELLREVKLQDKATLLLRNVGAQLGHSDTGLVTRSLVLFLDDELLEPVVELQGYLDRLGGDFLLLAQKVHDVLFGIPQALLELADILLGWCRARNLVVTADRPWSLIDKKNWATEVGGFRDDQVDAVVLAHVRPDLILHTLGDLVGRTNDGNGIIIFIGWQENSTTGLLEELVRRESGLGVTNDELVTAALDLKLLQEQLLAKLGSATLNLCLERQDSRAVALQLDVVFNSRLEDRSLSGCRGGRGCLGRPHVVGRDADLRAIGDTRPAEQVLPGSRNEGVELGGDAPDLGVHLGRAVANNLLDLLLREGGRDGVSFNLHVDVDIVVKLVGMYAIPLVLWHLDAGSRLLLQGLDGGTLLSDDMGASGLGDGNLDGLLQSSKLASWYSKEGDWESRGHGSAYRCPNLVDKLLERTLSSVLGPGGLEGDAVGSGGDGDVGTRSPVDILDDVWQGPPQLVTRLHVLRAQRYGLNILSAGQRDGGDSRVFGRSGGAGGGSGGARGTVLSLTVGLVGDHVPLGDSLGSGLRLGTTKVREQLTRLGVQSGGSSSGGRLLLLAGCLLGQGRGARGFGGGDVGGQVLIDNIFNSDMVTLGGVFCMFLSQLLGSRHLFGGGNGGGSGSGSHCMHRQPVGRQTIQETKRELPVETF